MDGPMHFYRIVYVSILSTACWSLPESGPPRNPQMESRNFQHILSWQANSDPTVPTYYRVLYTDNGIWKTAKQCSNITQLSCNLTEDFEDIHTEYSAFVQSFIGTEVFSSSVLGFRPYTDTHLGPPEVNISSCLNCINVTIKLPTPENGKLLSLIPIYNALYYNITLKSLDGEHKRPLEITTKEIFNTVIGELYPSRNYCVSVTVTASLNKHFITSDWKCVTAGSVAQQGYSILTIAGAVCFSLMVAAALKYMHAGGYILLKTSLPRNLVFIRMLAYSPWTPKSEETASVEIIYREVKKKATESSGGGVSDEDDSDNNDSDAISNHDYTRRDILSRVPHSSDVPNGFMQSSTNSTSDDSSSQASEKPDTEPEDLEEHETDVEEDKDASRELLNPLSEVNCGYSSRQRNSACFTINLKTVLLGASEENGDSSAALLAAQEDAADWQCTRALEAKLLDDTESVQKLCCHNSSHEWQNSSHSSDESDSSDSDMGQKTEYLRR